VLVAEKVAPQKWVVNKALENDVHKAS